MVKTELIKRSPLRILEMSTNGGIQAGQIGVITSARGGGKTACLVHIATDQLLLGKHLIHVSFSGRADHILNWYEIIFKEIAKTKGLESPIAVQEELISRRVILNFNQSDASLDQLKKSISALVSDGHFKAETVIIDGYDFRSGTPQLVSELKAFVQELQLGVWMSADMPDQDTSDDGIPDTIAPYIADISVIIALKQGDEFIHLELLKDHNDTIREELSLRLDPKTMLIAESDELS